MKNINKKSKSKNSLLALALSKKQDFKIKKLAKAFLLLATLFLTLSLIACGSDSSSNGNGNTPDPGGNSNTPNPNPNPGGTPDPVVSPFADAIPITIEAGGRTVIGDLAGDDNKYYSIQAPVGIFSFEITGNLDMQCFLHDSRELEIANNNDQSATNKNCKVVNHAITTASTYYIRIFNTGRGAVNSGRYILIISGFTNPDVHIENFSLSPNPIVEKGQPLALTVGIANSGTASDDSITSITLNYYQSQSQNDLFSDEPIITDIIDAFVLTRNKIITAPDVPATTTYYYGVCAMAAGEKEANNDNNCSDAMSVAIFSPLVITPVHDENDAGTLELSGARSVASAQLGDSSYLFVAGERDDGVSVFEVGTGGALSTTGSTTDNSELELDGAYSVASAQIGTNGYLFVAGQVDDGVSVFKVDANGTLSTTDNIDDANATDDLKLDGARSVASAQVRGKTFLFVVGRNDNGVSVFEVDANGTLSTTDSANITSPNFVVSAQVGANTFLFVASFFGLDVFEVGADGTLSTTDSTIDNAELEIKNASSVASAQLGDKTFLFVTGSGDDGVSVFEVDANGTLHNTDNVDDITGSKLVTTTSDLELDGARSVASAQVGVSTYIFVAGVTDSGVSVFEVNTDGNLLNTTNIPDNGDLNLHGASSVAVAQIGGNSYLFVAGNTDNGVSVFEMGRPANHSFANALNIRLGQNYSSNLNGSPDYYRIYLFVGDFSFETTGSVDTRCSLFDNSQTIVGVENVDGGGIDENCKITRRITEADYYYLRITGNSATDIGNYNLKLNQ